MLLALKVAADRRVLTLASVYCYQQRSGNRNWSRKRKNTCCHGFHDNNR